MGGSETAPIEKLILVVRGQRVILAADLAKAAVEARVLGPHRGVAPANRGLVLTHGLRQRTEAPLGDVPLGHRIELPRSFDHPYGRHPREPPSMSDSSRLTRSQATHAT